MSSAMKQLPPADEGSMLYERLNEALILLQMQLPTEPPGMMFP